MSENDLNFSKTNFFDEWNNRIKKIAYPFE